MTLIIELPPELEAKVRRLAAANRQTVNEWVLDAIRERLAREEALDELCEPTDHSN